MQQEFTFINGNTGYKSRLHRSLNEGMRNMRNAYGTKNGSENLKTYYLLKDGNIVSHREWRQLGSPNHVVHGTKNGCQSHWARTINLQ
jgi:hypothetical protein